MKKSTTDINCKTIIGPGDAEFGCHSDEISVGKHYDHSLIHDLHDPKTQHRQITSLAISTRLKT